MFCHKFVTTCSVQYGCCTRQTLSANNLLTRYAASDTTLGTTARCRLDEGTLMSQQFVEHFHAGTGRNYLSDFDNQALLIGASKFEMDQPSRFDKWPFLLGPAEESLHKRIFEKLQAQLTEDAQETLSLEQQGYEAAFDSWCSDVKSPEPELNSYPILNDHLNSVSEVERTITRAVLNELTINERRYLKNEESIRPGLAPRPMHDEVVKRISEEARKYLNDNANEVFPREHNRT